MAPRLLHHLSLLLLSLQHLSYLYHVYDHLGSHVLLYLHQGALKMHELEHQNLSAREHLHSVHPRQLGGRNFVEIRAETGTLIGSGIRVASEFQIFVISDVLLQGDR